mmetsp:Transcript_58273/g.182905  ORF Transcript_58273/g.182905 Transcript_58273/m.182905 type:complete len:475 (-) Transcript_58273:337-1761(-)
MALEAVHLRGSEPSLPEHRVDALLLGRAVRRRQARAAAVLVRLASGEAAQHGVAGRLVVLDLEDDRAGELSSGITVGRCVEREGAPFVAQHARAAAAHEGPLVEHEVEAVHDGRRHLLALLEAKVQLADVSADERRGAGGVNRHAGPLEVHGVGEPVRDDRVGCGGRAVGARQVDHARTHHTHPVVLVDAGKMPYVLRILLEHPLVPAPLDEGHVGHLHDLALARVHALCLCWRDLKELVVKVLHALDPETPMPRVGRAVEALRVVVEAVVPPHEGNLSETVRGRLAHAVPEPVPALGAGPVAAVHPVDHDLRRRRGGRTGAQHTKHLDVSLRRGREGEVGGLGHEERGQGQRLPLDVERVLVARVGEDEQGVGLCLQLNLLPALQPRYERQGAASRTDELHQGQLLPDHRLQVPLGVAVLDIRVLVLPLLALGNGHLQEHVGPAEELEAQRFQRVRFQKLAECSEVAVHGCQR